MKNTIQTPPETQECWHCGQQAKEDPCELCGHGIVCRRCELRMDEKTEGYHKWHLCRDCESELLDIVDELVEAGRLVLEELDQWKAVMDGQVDPRTAEAIDAMDFAIRKANGKAA